MKYVREYASGEYEEKKSRFIGEIFPVRCEEEAGERLREVQKKYYDARHHCYAFVLGDSYDHVKQSDDGEPSQTAGLPILNVLKGNDIHDAMIVVTRYFGGTLLGTGGLVRSYTSAANAAVSAATLVTGVDGHRVRMQVGYELLGKVRYQAESLGIREERADFGAAVELSYLVPPELLHRFEAGVQELSAGGVTLAISDARWYNL